MGQRCLDTRTLTFENVSVPAKNIVGNIGDGFSLSMKAFDQVRPVISSLACGLTQRALDEASNYAINHKTFVFETVKRIANRNNFLGSTKNL